MRTRKENLRLVPLHYVSLGGLQLVSANLAETVIEQGKAIEAIVAALPAKARDALPPLNLDTSAAVEALAQLTISPAEEAAASAQFPTMSAQGAAE